MKRLLADLALSLYPKAWRRRYAEEVSDLLSSRPVRMRTVIDLVRGAADAWLHLRSVPGAGPVRIPLAAVLTVAGAALSLLWNPGIRDVASLHGAWAEAASSGGVAGTMRDSARMLFAAAGIIAVLSMAPLLRTCVTAMRHSVHGPAVRMTARRVVVTTLFLAAPVGVAVLLFVAIAFLDWGYPVGPLGTAMIGGFLAPVVLALVLPPALIAARAPALGFDTRSVGAALASAAILDALAWSCVAVPLAMGLEKASWSFVAMVAVSALLSVGMSALVARSVLERSRPMLSGLNLA
ncbi:hypothetical protein ABZ897_13245 [Nonomuraea sp. NPDC046802]|uniref:hypothetical protein n=1 Tax=Nonomuraea sp. NPDC046802 TaxID=3154919 RepID=UPI0033D54122